MLGSSVNIYRHLFVRFLLPSWPKRAYLLVLHVIGKISRHPLVLELDLDLPDAVSALNVIYLTLVLN